MEGIEDLEGDLCAAVREVIGEAVPMTAEGERGVIDVSCH